MVSCCADELLGELAAANYVFFYVGERMPEVLTTSLPGELISRYQAVLCGSSALRKDFILLVRSDADLAPLNEVLEKAACELGGEYADLVFCYEAREINGYEGILILW